MLENQTNQEEFYVLDIRSEKTPLERIQVKEKIEFGSSDSWGIGAPRGWPAGGVKFFLQSNVLCMQILKDGPEAELNTLALRPGRMYILEKGDALKLGDIEIIIRQEFDKGPGGETKILAAQGNIEQLAQRKKEKTNSKNLPENNSKAVPSSSPSPLSLKEKMPRPLSKSDLPKERVTSAPPPSGEFAGALQRALGQGLDFLLSLGLYSILSFHKELWEKVHLVLLPLTSGVQKGLSMILEDQNLTLVISEFIIIFIMLQFIATTLLGRTFGQWIQGLETDSFDAKASGPRAILRGWLGIVTWPLIILDWPVLRRGASLKERIFKSYILRGSKTRALFGPILTIIISAFLWVGPAFFFGQSYLTEINIQDISNKKTPPLGKEKNWSDASKAFGVIVKSYRPSYISMYPYQSRRSRQEGPALLVFDRQAGSSLLMSREEGLEDFLGQQLSPLFGVILRMAYSTLPKQKGPMTTAQVDRLRDILVKSLTLSSSNLNTFLDPYVLLNISLFLKIKEGLVTELQQHQKSAWKIFKGRNHLYLMVDASRKKGGKHSSFIPLGHWPLRVYSLKYSKKSASTKSVIQKIFLSQGSWNATRKTQMPGREDTPLTALGALDELQGKEIKVGRIESFFQRAFTNSPSQKESSTQKKALESIIKSLERRKGSGQDIDFSPLINLLAAGDNDGNP